MTIKAVRDKVDNWLAPRWDWLVGKQEAYHTNHGHYFQGLWTHLAEIEQNDLLTGDTIPDNLTSKPSDQEHTWHDAVGGAFDSLPFPARLRLDVYDGTDGQGWVAKLEIIYAGNLYRRSKQVGSEQWRTKDWALIDTTKIEPSLTLWQRLFG